MTEAVVMPGEGLRQALLLDRAGSTKLED